jgi:hypothetical protein
MIRGYEVDEVDEVDVRRGGGWWWGRVSFIPSEGGIEGLRDLSK